MNKPPAAVSLDLDNLWTYLKTRGDPSWLGYPSYLKRFVPNVLKFFERRRLRVTVFIVGRDAGLDGHASILHDIAAAGHEIGNHSFDHEPWLAAAPAEAQEAEIVRAESAIVDACGVRPACYRGPGFSWSPALLEILADRGYALDASTLPTFIGPLGRLFYFSRARLKKDDRQQRARLFGGFADGFRPVRPYFWMLSTGRRILEIPVSTIPGLRIPFHLSYLLYLSRFGEGWMRAYFDSALRACRWAGVGPSFLLHPLDFLAPQDAPGLAFFPGMDINIDRKLRLAGWVMDRLAERFELVPLGGLAARTVAAPKGLRTIPIGDPRRSHSRGRS